MTMKHGWNVYSSTEEIPSDTETEIHSQQFPEDKLSLADEERYRGDTSPSDHGNF